VTSSCRQGEGAILLRMPERTRRYSIEIKDPDNRSVKALTRLPFGVAGFFFWVSDGAHGVI
jgi:hypothetical protein